MDSKKVETWSVLHKKGFESYQIANLMTNDFYFLLFVSLCADQLVEYYRLKVLKLLLKTVIVL